MPPDPPNFQSFYNYLFPHLNYFVMLDCLVENQVSYTWNMKPNDGKLCMCQNDLKTDI